MPPNILGMPRLLADYLDELCLLSRRVVPPTAIKRSQGRPPTQGRWIKEPASTKGNGVFSQPPSPAAPACSGTSPIITDPPRAAPLRDQRTQGNVCAPYPRPAWMGL